MLTITNEDNMAMMARYPDKHFDLAIVDPPYGIGMGKKEQYHKGALTTYKSKPWDSAIPTKDYWNELFRVSKNVIVWGGNYFTEFLPPQKNWIVWDKEQPPNTSFSQYELAWSNCKGQATIFKKSIARCGNKVSNNKIKAIEYMRIHPTQKPIQLYNYCLEKYAKPGDKILDTHLGSGSIAIACHDYGYDLTATELDKDYFDAAMKRINNHIAQQKLF